MEIKGTPFQRLKTKLLFLFSILTFCLFFNGQSVYAADFWVSNHAELQNAFNSGDRNIKIYINNDFECNDTIYIGNTKDSITIVGNNHKIWFRGWQPKKEHESGIRFKNANLAPIRVQMTDLKIWGTNDAGEGPNWTANATEDQTFKALVYIYNSAVNIYNCEFANSHGIGLHLDKCRQYDNLNTIDSCQIHDSTATGLLINNSDFLIIHNSYFWWNGGNWNHIFYDVWSNQQSNSFQHYPGVAVWEEDNRDDHIVFNDCWFGYYNRNKLSDNDARPNAGCQVELHSPNGTLNGEFQGIIQAYFSYQDHGPYAAIDVPDNCYMTLNGVYNSNFGRINLSAGPETAGTPVTEGSIHYNNYIYSTSSSNITGTVWVKYHPCGRLIQTGNSAAAANVFLWAENSRDNNKFTKTTDTWVNGYAYNSGNNRLFCNGHNISAIHDSDGFSRAKGTNANVQSPHGNKAVYTDSITVSATTANGYSFKEWKYSNASVGNSNSYKFTLNSHADRTYYAYANKLLYQATCEDRVGSTSGTLLGKPSSPANPKTGLSTGTTVSGSEWGANTGNNVYYNGYKYKSSTSATINNGNVTVYRIFEEVVYQVTCEDRVGSSTGTLLGRPTSPANPKTGIKNGTTVSGAEWGTNATDDYYYDGYKYKSSTSVTVNKGNATVYRLFEETTYNARCIDINQETGKTLGTPSPNPKTGIKNGAKISGSDWGTNSPYEYYYYVECTSETVNKGDVTVYRYFLPIITTTYDISRGAGGIGVKLDVADAKSGDIIKTLMSLRGGTGAAVDDGKHGQCKIYDDGAYEQYKNILAAAEGSGVDDIFKGEVKDGNHTILKFMKEMSAPTNDGVNKVTVDMLPALRFDYNLGNAPVIEDDMVFYTSELTVPECEATNGVKTFKEWNSSWNGLGASFKPGDKITAATAVKGASVQGQKGGILTLYAIWSNASTNVNTNY